MRGPRAGPTLIGRLRHAADLGMGARPCHLGVRSILRLPSFYPSVWVVLLIGIPATSLFGTAWLDWLRMGLPSKAITILLGGAILGGLLGTAGHLVRRGNTRSYTLTGLAAAVLAGLLWAVPAGPRWAHLLLFAPYGFASQRWLSLRHAGYAIAALAIADEGLQALLDYRTGAPIDVGINTAAGAAGLAIGIATEKGSA